MGIIRIMYAPPTWPAAACTHTHTLEHIFFEAAFPSMQDVPTRNKMTTYV